MGRVTRPALWLLVVLVGCDRGGGSSETPPRRVGEVAESTLAWPVPNPEQAIEVEVRNAAGVTGLARAVTRQLRAGGFDVVTYGSHDGASDSTLVLARRGTMEAAERVRSRLGQGYVRERLDTTRRVDVTVILGRDFRRAP